MGAPPGGPEDTEPPRVEAVIPAPDSVSVSVDSRVRLVFSENVRRPEAERLFSLAPYRGRLFFEWERNAVNLRPAEPLKDDVTYRIRVAPGLTDMHRVKSDSAFVSYFSTGDRFSPGRVDGYVFHRDSLVAGAIVRAVPFADTSLMYETWSDSSGRYVLPYLSFGEYSLSAFRDRTRNGRFDFTRDEGADTVLTVGGEPLRLDFHLVLADTTAPVMLSVAVLDSQRLALAYDDPLDSAQALSPGQFDLRRGDSTGTTVGIGSAVLDSLDIRRLLLELAEPLGQGERYWLRASGITNEAGLTIVPGRDSRTFTAKWATAPTEERPPSGDRRR